MSKQIIEIQYTISYMMSKRDLQRKVRAKKIELLETYQSERDQLAAITYPSDHQNNMKQLTIRAIQFEIAQLTIELGLNLQA